MHESVGRDTCVFVLFRSVCICGCAQVHVLVDSCVCVLLCERCSCIHLCVLMGL